jgi:ligand-binding SRPBCC domain-containing protein
LKLRPIRPVVTVTSHLEAPVEEVWASASSFEGINREMSPLLQMIPPNDVRLDDESIATRGIVPVKLRGPFSVPLGSYPLRMMEIEVGGGFLEQTRMLPFLLWQHERRLSTSASGTVVTDSLGWDWRARRLDGIVAALVRRFFNHRHRQLRREFG